MGTSEIILTFIAFSAFIIMSYFLLIYYKCKNFYKRILDGEVGMMCYYYDNEERDRGVVIKYNQTSQSVTIRGFDGKMSAHYIKDIYPL